MSIKLRRWCDTLLEGGWLLAVVLITLYFNIYTKDSRIFEPQKALILRFLVTMMLAVWVVRTLEENRERLQETSWWPKAVWGIAAASLVLALGLFAYGLATWQDPLAGMVGETAPSFGVRVLEGLLGVVSTSLVLFAAGMALAGAGYTLRNSWRDALRTAMVIPALAYIAVHIISTIASVFPQASLYGGYVRQQGTLTVLSYIGLFFILAFNLRQREQLNRLITVILVTSLPAALYGIVQKSGIDPLPWMGNVEARVASTMGNAIFIAAYLIMVLALTGYRLLSTWEKVRQSPPPEQTPGGGNGILRPTYLRVLWGSLAAILAVVFLITPIVNSANLSAMRENPATKVEDMAQVWPTYGNNLLLFLGVAVLTLALPALLYTVLTMSRERWRPYAHLAALGLALLLVIVVMFIPGLLPAKSAVQTFVEGIRVNGFFWAGYLSGLIGLALLSRWQHARLPWGHDALWSDAVYIILVAQSVALFMVIQAYLPNSPYPTKWPLYLIALIALFFLPVRYIVATASTHGRVGYLAQLGGYLILAFLQLLCIFLTQSRGPLLGLLAGIFFFALLWPWRRRIRWALITVVVGIIVGGTLLAIFNLPDTPIIGNLLMRNPQMASFVENRIVPLKSIPYIGRLGKMFDASSGTGRVRILIWFGDEIGKGSVGMITANPLRTLVGYGPETMHVAYNPYYPPELAHVEKRNASPDRAHNAIIDELVTMGALGLAGYLFYFIAFFVLVWRLLWKAPDIHNQALGVGLFSLGAAHFAETLFGIPIVSTRMYMWIAMGIAVALTFMPPFWKEEAAPVAEEDAAEVQHAAHRRPRRHDRRRPQRGIPTAWTAAYVAVAVGALLFTARVDLKPMWADLLFWQSQQLKAQSDAIQSQASQVTDKTVLQRLQESADKYSQESLQSLLQTVSLMPHEDFFYLSLAQVYLVNAQQLSQAAQQMEDPQQQQVLLQEQQSFFKSTEQSILRARDLSPLNTDHYRNLAALYMSWFSQSQPENLARSISYGEQALSLTRDNADLHNRLAQAYQVAATYWTAPIQKLVLPLATDWLRDWEKYHLTSGGRTGDTHLAIVAQYRQTANDLLADGQTKRALQVLAAAELQYSLFLDNKFADTYQALGDLYWRTLNMPTEAAWIYGDGLRLKPTMLSDSQLSARLDALAKGNALDLLTRAYVDVAKASELALEQQKAATPAQKNVWHGQISDAYKIVGYIYILQGDRTAAIDAYQTALAHQDTFEAHKNLAILYQQAGQLDLALEQAQIALKIAQEKNQTKDVQDLQTFIQQLQQQMVKP